MSDKTSPKKYFWLKLKEDFFTSKEIKKLRKVSGGDTFVIIYLKMQLLSIKQEGYLKFDGIEDSFAEEIALTLDENEENVKMTLAFLFNYNLIEKITEDDYYMTRVSETIGKESDSADRVRKHRENIKREKLIVIDDVQKQPLTDAERQRKCRAKKNCETKQHVPHIEDYQNNKRYGGNYYLVMQRDKYKCAECGDIENLCVHHIDGYNENKPQNNNVNKMIVLCRSCHIKTHNNADINEDILNSIDYYNDSVTNLCNIDVTQSNTDVTKCNTEIEKELYIDIEKDIELKKSNEKKTKTKVFAIPTIDEIKEYCKERKNNVDAEKFFNHYESNGWMVGKTKMKNWQAAIRNWEKNSFDNNNKKQELKTHNHNEFANFEEYDFCAEYEEMMKEVEGKNV